MNDKSGLDHQLADSSGRGFAHDDIGGAGEARHAAGVGPVMAGVAHGFEEEEPDLSQDLEMLRDRGLGQT
ncbi:hypothetical protein JNW87_32740 [Micromonospora sp. ATA51]|nr:hypothetical protein [Micromonospora sp. ATA51]